MPDRRNAERLGKTLAVGLWLWCALASGCATTTGNAVIAGERAEVARDFDRAVVEYTKALRAKPGDQNIRLALERARLRAAQDHAFRARRFSADERYEDALAEYQLASELNPTDSQVDEALR